MSGEQTAPQTGGLPHGGGAWYAIHIRSRAEKKVEEELLRKNIETFLPMKRSLRHWSDRKKWVDLPLIPGYCFVRAGEGAHQAVLQTRHVAGFVRFGGKPAVIPENQILFLKRMLKQSDYAWEVTGEPLSPGQIVEITAGPMIGLEAELISLKGKSRVGIRIIQISNNFLVDIPLTDVAARNPGG